MATLERVRSDADDLLANIPAPFPVHLLEDDLLDQLTAERVDYTPTSNVLHASLAAVQHSCLITLANILALPPTAEPGIPLHQVLSESPLACLVRALGAHAQPDQTEAALLAQLRIRVDAYVPSLNEQDAHLARAIVSLLLDLDQLSPNPLSQSAPSDADTSASASPYATIASLQRQLSSLQVTPSMSTPAEVRIALLWARIDEQLDTVVSLCKARASSPPRPHTSQPPLPHSENGLRPSFETLPPEYDADYMYEHPPSYTLNTLSEEKPSGELRLADQYPPEKVSVCAPSMETSADVALSSDSLDLDAITHAIERLYAVAPQLANQRVELRREKIVQMEKAKAGKGKARKFADTTDPEFDKLLDLLGKASTREIPDQSAVIDPQRIGREKGAADIEEQVCSSLLMITVL